MWVVCDRECGNIIEYTETLEEAELVVRDYEEIDKAEGNYTPDFYEIKKWIY